MIRMCFATLAVLCSLGGFAQAQVYTTYYGPGYSAYGSGYSAGPAYSGYGTAYGPLRVFDPRWWAGSPPYGSNYVGGYSSGVVTPSYTAAYSPYTAASAYSPAYTAGYGPSYSAFQTSYYAPAYTPSYGAYYGSAYASTDGCCVVPTTACCSPCTSCGLACAGGNCPGGNCGMNYGPTDMSPTPDSSMSGSSGSRRFESESDNRDPVDPIDAPEGDGFRRSDPNNNYEGGTPRGAGYGPERSIEQKNNGSDLPRKPTDGPEADVPEDGFNAVPSDSLPSEGLEKELGAPEDTPAADRSLLDLDSRLTQSTPVHRHRHTMQARFGSPKVARAEVNPSALPSPTELRVVKK
jgi:hypothetical protein